MIHTLSPKQLVPFQQQHPEHILLDIREDEEVMICRLANSLHIPMSLVPLRHHELSNEVPIVIYCHHGIRSLSVARYLEHVGFEKLYNLTGGIDAYALEVAPEMQRY